MSTSEFKRGPQMWWHADLPAAASGPVAPEPSAPQDRTAPAGDGADLLEWILPTLSAERTRRDTLPEGGPRRAVRRQLQAED